MSLEIAQFKEKHLEDAAALVGNRYRIFRQRLPLLPSKYETMDALIPLLEDFVTHAPGVVALDNGRLSGFLLGRVFPSFRGKRTVFSPEWANGADLENSRRIYQEMYAQLSAAWVADACFVHMISLLSHDLNGIDGWHWLGFGLMAVDAIRELDPVPGQDTGLTIQRASMADLDQVVDLIMALRRYMMAAPIFLLGEEIRDRAYFEEWLADPDHAMWLADQGGEAVACMGHGAANPDACTIIDDEKTTSITSAFTLEEMRGGGIATALLNQCLTWARHRGYQRCAVDFEPMNVLGSRFWMRYFQPVCFSLARQVDERVG